MKRINYVALVMLLLWVSGCGETDRPPAPPPPPQIGIERFNAGSPNASFRLPDNEVFDILVDSQGRTWFSTEAGIAMRDGTQPIVNFDDFNGIPNRKCRGIAELNGKIWVGTWGGGVAWWDGNVTWTALPVGVTRVVDGQVFDLAADDSSLWIATVAGLSQYVDDDTRPMADRFHQHTDRLGGRAGDNVITSVAVNSDSTEVWVSKLPTVSDPGGGITILEVPDPDPGLPGGEIQVRTDNTAIPDKRVSEVVLNPATGIIWASFPDAGLASVDPANSVWTHFTTVEGFFSDLAQSVALRSNGEVWVGTLKGVSRMTPAGTITNFIGGSGMPAERIRRVYVDGMDRVWLSFVGAGAGRVTSAP
ncbi:MAG: two-component regulator propeller domain-containing protein [Candidatus Krumholzibacteriia bacterium]